MRDGLTDESVGIRHSAVILGCDLRQVNERKMTRHGSRRQRIGATHRCRLSALAIHNLSSGGLPRFMYPMIEVPVTARTLPDLLALVLRRSFLKCCEQFFRAVGHRHSILEDNVLSWYVLTV
jgi:hypothetical protein